MTTEPPSTTTTKAKVAGPLLTSCHSVLHIGDSTSESLVSPDYLPDPLQRLTARYAAVGVVSEDMQISGARSIVETYAGQPNAYTVAQQAVAAGYKGCWVVAMGVDDAADIAVGSNVEAPERIQRMMSVIGAQPVMWVAVRTRSRADRTPKPTWRPGTWPCSTPARHTRTCGSWTGRVRCRVPTTYPTASTTAQPALPSTPLRWLQGWPRRFPGRGRPHRAAWCPELPLNAKAFGSAGSVGWTMRFAFKTAPQHTNWADMLAVWQAADDIEIFESGWTFDHFYPDHSPTPMVRASRGG